MKLWYFDENRRIYERDTKGNVIGPPIWREHWHEVAIIGETSRSWIISYTNDKVPKKSFPGKYAVSQEQIDRLEFVSKRYQLSRRIDQCRDYETLQEIKKLLDKHDAEKS
jgi:hypothetical protein